jgi:hypothetical protein
MPASATQTPGLVDTWGGKFENEVVFTGPKSYVNGTGELLNPAAFGCPNNLLFAAGSITVSGTYYGMCRPAAASGYTKWYLQYFTSSNGNEVTNATDLSAESIIVFGMGV